jgi:phage terminase small subunit
VALGYNATEPNQLRGPQFDAAWCDELAKWRYARETWDMLQFGLRLGEHPRALVTTTPRPTELVKALVAGKEGKVHVTRGSTMDNRANLAKSFIRKVLTPGGALIDAQDWDDDVAGFISSVEVVKKPSGEHDEEGRPVVEHVHKIKAWDKMAALEKLGKHLGMFVDRSKHEVSGPDGGPIQTESGSEKLASFLNTIADRAGG